LVLEIFTFCAPACVVPCLLPHSASAGFASPTYHILQNFGDVGILNRCATSQTVPGSIPGGLTGFFNDIFPSDRTMGRLSS